MNENIIVKVGADITNMQKNLKSATGDLEGFGSKVNGVMKSIGAIAAAGTAIAGAALFKFGKDSVFAAADMQATNAQFTQVFGDMGESATSSLEAMGKEFGMLPERLKGPLSMTTSMFKGLGMGTKEAMETAAGAVTIAADAAAFYDKSYEDANAALNSFIKGNYEGGEAIGLFANESQLAAWASKELGTDWKKLDEAGKQVTRLKFAEAMQESAGATGQASRESESLTNMQGNLASAWSTLLAEMGEPILPMVTDWMKQLTDKVAAFDAKQLIADITSFYEKGKGAVVMIGQFLDKWSPLLAGIAAGAIAFKVITTGIAAYNGIMAAYRAIVVAGTAVQWSLNAAMLANPIGAVVLAIGLLVAALVLAYKNVGWFRDMVNTAWQVLKDATAIAFNYVKEIVQKVMADIMVFVKGILSKLQAFWSEHGASITKLVSGSFKAVWTTIQAYMGYIQGIFQVIWPIISGYVKIAWGLIKLNVENGLDIILGLVGTVMSLLEGDWSGAWDSIKGIAEDIWGNIEGFFKDVDLLQIGKDIIAGLIKGISSMASSVTSAVSGLANLIPSGVKKMLDINSPSRVLAKLGMYTGMGLAQGLDGEVSTVEKSAQRLANASIAKPTLSYTTPGTSHGSLSGALSGAISASVNINESEESRLLGILINAVREGQVISLDGRKVGESVASTVGETLQRKSDMRNIGRGTPRKAIF